CVVLVVDLFVPDSQRRVFYWRTPLGLVATPGFSLFVFHETPGPALGNAFVARALAALLEFFRCITLGRTALYSRVYLTARGLFRGETFVLTMFALLGMMVMISAAHFLTLYLGLELMSLALYALVALQRDSNVAVEASMKYFVLGALASGLL